MLRIENPDVVYRTEKEKYFAAADEIQKLHENGQPVLVGTTSIEKSERLSELLKKKGIKHVVLNAKYHEREAEIVAQAGRKGMVTIATNMAGRGTDILLGGNPEFMAKQECVKKGIAQPLRAAAGQDSGRRRRRPRARSGTTRGNEYVVPTDQWNEIFNRYKAQTDKEHDEVIGVGGLHILGTERHEARRIDNQLRGRAGRQGDPGSSRFYLSLEDDLMRIFAKEWVSNLLQRLGMEEGVPIESQHDHAPHRGRAEGRRSAELRSPQTPARVRRRDEQAARGRLRPAPPVAGRRRPERTDPRRLRLRHSQRRCWTSSARVKSPSRQTGTSRA